MTPEASAEVVTAKKKGEGGLEKDVDPNAGCTCYMSFTGTANIENLYWFLEEDTNGPGTFAYVGNSEGWKHQSGTGYLPYPSPYFPLDPPEAGCHRFVYTLATSSGSFPNPAPTDATLYTSVKCYNAEGDLQTTTYHAFVFSDGVPIHPLIPEFVYIWRLFSCLYLFDDGTANTSSDCAPSTNLGGK